MGRPAHSQRERAKGRRESGTFVILPHAFLESASYQGLSLASRRVLDILLLQIRVEKGGKPRNNGWLSCTAADAEEIGIKGHSTIIAGVRGLEGAGIIVRTAQGSHASQGGRRAPNLYAITLWPISDDQRSKRKPLDLAPGTPIVGRWLAPLPVVETPRPAHVAAPHGRLLEVPSNPGQCPPVSPA